MGDRKSRAKVWAKYKRTGFATETEQKRLRRKECEAKRNKRKKAEGEKSRTGEIEEGLPKGKPWW